MQPRADVTASALRERLARDAWFRHATPALQDGLLALGGTRRLNTGEHLFFRGDAPDGLYAVLDGALRVSGLGEDGKEAVLALLEPPAWLGEVSLFDRLPRTHDAVAEGPTEVWHVPQAPLLALLAREPGCWRDLGVLMATRLRLAFIAMEDMALHPAEARLARRLVWLCEVAVAQRPAGAAGGEVVLPLRQSQLAAMLSLSRQTTNQILQGLQDRGVLRVAYGRITVCDGPALCEAAGLSKAEQVVLSQWRGGGEPGPADSPRSA